MKKLLLIVLGLLIIGAGVVFALNNDTKTDVIIQTDKKILIAYYSRSGNTKSVAKKIQSKVKGDLFEIKTTKAYPSDYNQMTQIAQKEQEANELPEIQSFPENIEQYDIIFVGTPVWWGKMANPMKTFLTKENLKTKTVVPFITHGGGGKYTIAEDIAKLTGAKTLSPLVLQGNGGINANSEINKWLKALNL